MSAALVSAVLAMGALAAHARADDWPQWLGPQRDGIWRETGIVDKFPEGSPPVRWRAKVAQGYSGPAVANGRVYLTDRVLAKGTALPKNQFSRARLNGTERVLCFNEADGKPLWQYEYDCPYTISYPLGPRTTPTIYLGKVYTLGAEGNLVCLDADTGKKVWDHDLKSEYQTKSPLWGYSSHVLVDGNKCYSMVGGKGSAVVAFDKDTGKEVWKALTAKELGYCPPTIYDVGGRRELIIWHGESVNSLDPETGKVYWSQPLVAYSGMSIAVPRLHDDRLFLTAAMNTAIMLRLGVDKPGVEPVWNAAKEKKKGIHSVFSTPYFDGEYVYGMTDQGVLMCIRADTGEQVWQTLEPNGGKKLNSGDVFLIKHGDRFFLWTEKGDLIIANLSPKGYQEISRTHVLDPSKSSTAWGRPVLWSHPAFANRSVYARNDDELICVSLATSDAK
jgi:outer membrane protein assembly factor BamB